jgi:hypothetical protein
MLEEDGEKAMKTKMKNKLARSEKLLSFVLEESVDRRERYWLAREDEGGSVYKRVYGS